MKNAEIREQVEETVAAAIAAGMSVVINRGLPYVAVNLGPDNDYFFQEHEADDLLQSADLAARKFRVSPEDWILHVAQGW